MTRGRPKKAPQIKKLEGNPGKRHIEAIVIEAAGEAAVPDHLDNEASACFAAVKASMPPKMYGRADSFALAAFSTAWSWHHRATIELSKPETSPISAGSTGQPQPNPWFKILKAMSEEMRAWGARLGLDPQSRAAIKVPQSDSPKSKFEGLFSIKGGRQE